MTHWTEPSYHKIEHIITVYNSNKREVHMNQNTSAFGPTGRKRHNTLLLLGTKPAAQNQETTTSRFVYPHQILSMAHRFHQSHSPTSQEPAPHHPSGTTTKSRQSPCITGFRMRHRVSPKRPSKLKTCFRHCML